MACAQHRFEIKYDLLHHWSEGLDSKTGLQFPFVAEYSKYARALTYVASDHGVGPNSNIFKTIRWAFEKYNPQMVIVEGYPPTAGISPDSYRQMIQKCVDRDFQGCSEPPYVLWLAMQGKHEYQTGEPSDSIILEALREKGFSAKDFIGLNVLGRTIQDRREGKNEKLPLNEYLELQLKRASHGIEMEKPLTVKDFQIWFEAHSGEAFLRNTVQESWVYPLSGPKANYFQTISSAITYARDKNILKTFADSLNQYDRVLVVYGGSHFSVQKDVLKEMMGDPVISKPY